MESIQKNQTKINPDRFDLRKKARIVAKGFAQQEGIDFTEVFSPVAHIETVRVFMAIGAQRNWRIFQLEFKIVFLNKDFPEE